MLVKFWRDIRKLFEKLSLYLGNFKKKLEICFKNLSKSLTGYIISFNENLKRKLPHCFCTLTAVIGAEPIWGSTQIGGIATFAPCWLQP